MQFEWDAAKRASNIAKHGLDFADGLELFNGQPALTYQSAFADEQRLITVGMISGRLVTLVWTRREQAIRFISLRRAHDAEKRDYRTLFGG